MNITIYTKENCPNCDSAKRLLTARGLKYTEVDIEVGERRANFMNAFPTVRSMPQIFIGEQRVGGLLGLQEAFKEMEKANESA